MMCVRLPGDLRDAPASVISREEIFVATDFWLPARCAPQRAKAQRAAPFGKLGTIGFVLHVFSSRARAVHIRVCALEL
jgi:hypothetical protein